MRQKNPKGPLKEDLEKYKGGIIWLPEDPAELNNQQCYYTIAYLPEQ